MNKDVLEKLAQYTKLDESLIPDNSAVGRYYAGIGQQQLPFKNEHGVADWKLQQDIKDATAPKRKVPTSPLNLKYPELSPEQIRYRGLNEKEIEQLRKNDDYKYERPNRYDYYSDQSKPTYGPWESDYSKNWELNELLPEDAKKRVIDKYNKLREAATKFQAKYNEANALAGQEVNLDYSGSYIDLFKNFGKFIVANVHRYLGVLFGVLPEMGRNRYNSRAINIAEFINKGINIFNITPNNMQAKLHEMSAAIFTMRAIIDEYERRKKVLKKLPLVERDVKSYLLKKDHREFLKWLDIYFPNDKKEFMESAVRDVLDENYYGTGFRIGSLKKIKVYKDIYENAAHNSTTKLYISMKDKIINEIRARLQDELTERVMPKIAAFKTIVENSTSDNMDELIKYVYKNYRLDLKPVLNYVQISFVRYYEAKNADPLKGLDDPQLKSMTEGVDAKEEANKNFAAFKDAFIKNISAAVDFGEDGGELDIRRNYKLKSRIEEPVKNLMAKYFIGKTKEGRDMLQVQHKLLDQLTNKDIDEMALSFFRNLIIDKLPNFHKLGVWGYSYVFPGFTGIGNIIKETGKFSIDAVINNVHSKVPFVPKEFLLNLVRSLFKGQIAANSWAGGNIDKIFEELFYLNGTSPQTAMKVFLDLLKRSGKFNPNSFTNEFVKSYDKINHTVGTFIAEQNYSGQRDHRKLKFSEADTIEFFSIAIRNVDTVDRDVDNIKAFIKFVHDNAGDLDKSSMIKLVKNKSFHQYTKNGIVNKLFNIYSRVKSLGGLQGIYKKYGDAIKSLKAEGFVSKSFDANIRFVIRVFNSGEQISPASQYFKKMFDITSTLETDLETIEEGEALSEMLKGYQKKDERLFRLDIQINDRLRFRVLKDKDPRMLRVGVESGCCQRVGGVGENAARDSFINPMAGVVILEWKNNEGEWVLLTQSYFHFVPKDNSYILDNIEKNYSNVSDSGVDLSAAYAYLAQKTNEKWNVGYFLAGKGYSKINTGDFKTKKLRGGDPRFFDRRSGSPYSDFEASNAMDLLTPKFDFGKRVSGLTQESKDIKEAFEINICRIIRNGIAA